MFNEVFISYASEDYETAERLYHYLLQNGYSPWLDRKKIRVGANWDYEIKTAIKKSTFFISLLSSISVSKRGYVQREFRLALNIAETKLIDDIYIIPILLDKCEVPDALSRFQWREISQENAMRDILESLNSQRTKYLSGLPADKIEIGDYSSLSIDLKNHDFGSFEYHCDLPLFHANKYFDSQFVNTFIQQKALAEISEYRRWVNEDRDWFEKEGASFYFDIGHSISKLDQVNLSLTITYDSYFGGAAHPNTKIDTLNFAFHPDRVLRFSDVAEYSNLREFLNDCLAKYGDEEQKECLSNYFDYVTEENIDFTFTDETLEIVLVNQVPRVIMALGFLEVPLKDLAKPAKLR